MDEIEEDKLWLEFKGGDRKSFSLIIEKYYDILFKYGLSIYYDDSFIKDCLQDMFINLWQTKEKLTNVTSIKYYLIISFRRLVLKNVSSSRNEIEISDSIFSNQMIFDTSIEEDIIETENKLEQSEQLKNALEKLPNRQKEAIHLKFYQKLNYQQIAQIMDISYPSLRNLISQAIKSLRKNY